MPNGSGTNKTDSAASSKEKANKQNLTNRSMTARKILNDVLIAWSIKVANLVRGWLKGFRDQWKARLKPKSKKKGRSRVALAEEDPALIDLEKRASSAISMLKEESEKRKPVLPMLPPTQEKKPEEKPKPMLTAFTKFFSGIPRPEPFRKRKPPKPKAPFS